MAEVWKTMHRILGQGPHDGLQACSDDELSGYCLVE